MSTIQLRKNPTQKFKLVKLKSNSHKFKPGKQNRKNFKECKSEKPAPKNYSTFTTSHLPKSGLNKPKATEKKKSSKVPRYHQVLQNSFPKDFNNSNMKKVKIKVKVKGDRETLYDYLDKTEIALTTQIMNERMPKKIKVKIKGMKEVKEPNPASLKFPKVIKKLLKKEKKERQAQNKKSKKEVKMKRKQKMKKMIHAMMGGDGEI